MALGGCCDRFVAEPERELVDYDLVFATGRCDIEFNAQVFACSPQNRDMRLSICEAHGTLNCSRQRSTARWYSGEVNRVLHKAVPNSLAHRAIDLDLREFWWLLLPKIPRVTHVNSGCRRRSLAGAGFRRDGRVAPIIGGVLGGIIFRWISPQPAAPVVGDARPA
jgi:hypothetical protein